MGLLNFISEGDADKFNRQGSVELEEIAPYDEGDDLLLGSSFSSHHSTMNHDDNDKTTGVSVSPTTTTTTTTTTTSSNSSQVAVNIVISFLGAGMLGIPYAISRSGWLLGCIALCGTSALNVYAMLLLPKVRRKLVLQQHEQQRLVTEGNVNVPHVVAGGAENPNTYGGIGRILLGPKGELFVNACLMISQVGFSTAYLIFIASSFSQLYPDLPRWKVCFGCVPLLTWLVQARDMHSLAPFSLIANCATALGLSSVLWQDIVTLVERHQREQQGHLGSMEQELFQHDVAADESNSSTMIQAIEWGGLSYIMAITLYSMEGVGLILSLETSCRNTAEFPWLLQRVITGITIFMCVFGSLSYAAFGTLTQAPITLNLGGGEGQGASAAATFVQGALCVALYLTYPVMMFPVWHICDERMCLSGTGRHTTHSSSTTSSRRGRQIALIRCVVVLFTAWVAYAVPNFGDYLALVGSSLCMILSFILPCWFHLQVFGREMHCCERLLNYLLLIGGTVFGISGTLQSLRNF